MKRTWHKQLPQTQKWHRRYLRLAREISSWSKDPSTKVGAVLVDNRRRGIGFGYNGFPKGVPDTQMDYEDRELKYKLVVHAEENAILNCPIPIHHCEATLFVWPLFPCNECAKVIIQAGVKQVVSTDTQIGRWSEANDLAANMLDHAGIDYIIYPAKEIDKDATGK